MSSEEGYRRVWGKFKANSEWLVITQLKHGVMNFFELLGFEAIPIGGKFKPVFGTPAFCGDLIFN